MSPLAGMGQWSRDAGNRDQHERRCQARYVPHRKEYTRQCGRPAVQWVIVEGDALWLCRKCFDYHGDDLARMGKT